MLKEKEQHIIVFEDDYTIAYLNPMAASLGHILLIPKKHYTILEQMEEAVVAHIFSLASKLSAVLFETLECGTNIILNNGAGARQSIPHVAVHIIPRKDGDNIKLTWQPQEISKEELAEIESNLKSQPAQEQVKQISEEDPMLKHLRRVP